MATRCIRCGSEVIYYRDSKICCVNPKCRHTFTLNNLLTHNREENKREKERKKKKYDSQ